MTDDYHAIHGPDEERFKGKPHGWIQWKGTDVCMDLHCVCGAHGHIDGFFFYHYACAKCGRKYAVGAHVPLIELTPEQVAHIESGAGCQFKTDAEVLEDDDGLASSDQPDEQRS